MEEAWGHGVAGRGRKGAEEDEGKIGGKAGERGAPEAEGVDGEEAASVMGAGEEEKRQGGRVPCQSYYRSNLNPMESNIQLEHLSTRSKQGKT